MAGKITEYSNTRSTFDDGDLFDVSAFLNPTYESQKTTWALLKTALNADLSFLTTETDPVFTASPAANVVDNLSNTVFLSGDGTYQSVSGTNIYTTDGALTGARTVTMGGNDIDFNGGVVKIGNPTLVGSELLNVDGRSQFNVGMGIGVAAGLTALKVAPSADTNKSLQLWDSAGLVEVLGVKGNKEWSLNSSSASRFGFGVNAPTSAVVRIQADGTNDALSIRTSAGVQEFTVEDNGQVGIGLSGGNVTSGIQLEVGGDTQIDGDTYISGSGVLSIGSLSPIAGIKAMFSADNVNSQTALLLRNNSAETLFRMYGDKELVINSKAGSEVGIGRDAVAGVALSVQANAVNGEDAFQVRNSSGIGVFSINADTGSQVLDRFYMDLPTYADDTAAGVGGLTTGMLYVETTSGNRYVASKS